MKTATKLLLLPATLLTCVWCIGGLIYGWTTYTRLFSIDTEVVSSQDIFSGKLQLLGNDYVHWSCDRLPRSVLYRTAPNEDDLFMQNMQILCSYQHIRELLTATIDKEYIANYERYYHRGWVDEAYVTFLKVDSTDNLFGQMVVGQVESVKMFSTRPIIVHCIDSQDTCRDLFPAKKYPHAVVVNIKSNELSNTRALDFDKWRAILLSRARVGVQLDADQFILPFCDNLFESARREAGERYPYPLMPIHWMSRDPEGGDYRMYLFQYAGHRSMRYGHAHIVWTYHALPFLAKYYKRALLTIDGVRYTDEELCNVMLWERNLTKAFCKWDNSFSREEFTKYLNNEPIYSEREYNDNKWYPQGVPVLFYSWHGCKDPSQTSEALALLQQMQAEGVDITKTLPLASAGGRYFYNRQEVLNAYPDIQCII